MIFYEMIIYIFTCFMLLHKSNKKVYERYNQKEKKKKDEHIVRGKKK